MIDVRRLAAVDVAFLGPKLILAEFAAGVAGPLALGVLTIFRSDTPRGRLFGAYLLGIGLNYVPLLLHAISIVRRGAARAEVAAEGLERSQLFRKYRRQSLWLLLPLVVAIAALAQWRRPVSV